MPLPPLARSALVPRSFSSPPSPPPLARVVMNLASLLAPQKKTAKSPPAPVVPLLNEPITEAQAARFGGLRATIASGIAAGELYDALESINALFTRLMRAKQFKEAFDVSMEFSKLFFAAGVRHHPNAVSLSNSLSTKLLVPKRIAFSPELSSAVVNTLVEADAQLKEKAAAAGPAGAEDFAWSEEALLSWLNFFFNWIQAVDPASTGSFSLAVGCFAKKAGLFQVAERYLLYGTGDAPDQLVSLHLGTTAKELTPELKTELAFFGARCALSFLAQTRPKDAYHFLMTFVKTLVKLYPELQAHEERVMTAPGVGLPANFLQTVLPQLTYAHLVLILVERGLDPKALASLRMVLSEGVLNVPESADLNRLTKTITRKYGRPEHNNFYDSLFRTVGQSDA
ncbi:hypothetical protein H696_00404 [Fonticula alba]|uniref:Uncharacterized protein n=1 Tax=Fonticula alba TaxID=691883 RepID=A0A058ZFX6_FONAL|nr:hypothetical protein H696_00404 [Fonticula alba]KCV72828.1 hypothetical protein H696_00404 [Fonticula alba]|eukprot:XP_009492529.1 hypothetical protein H696_00404 [Fonticula alba]